MKNVFITGVGRGIGKALAERFLEEGWFVIGTTRDGKTDIKNKNFKILTLELTSKESIENCVNELDKLEKRLHVIINNSGVLLDEDETTVLPEKLRETLEINVIGPIDLTEKILFLLEIGAHIINISSTAGSLSLVGHESHYEGHYPAYKISKCALNMYTRTLAQRLKDKIVSSIHPGWVKTEMGGDAAEITPEEAALHIYKLAISINETGQFWFNGQKMPW